MYKIAQIITHCFSRQVKGYLSPLSILILCCMLMILPASKVAAQSVPVKSPKELLLKIQASKPGTNRISLQIQLGQYYLYKPGELKNDLDSAINFFNQALQLSIKLKENDWRYKAEGMIGSYYEESGDKERCRQTFMSIIAYYHQTGNKQQEGMAWYSLAELYLNTMNDVEMQARLRYYQNARSLFLQTHDQFHAADALRGIASVQMRKKQFDLAEKELQQVLVEFKKLGYNKLHITLEMLQALEYDRGNYNRAIAYCLAALRNTKMTGDTAWSFHFYRSIAKSYGTSGQYKEALEWQRKAAAVKNPEFSDRCGMVQLYLKLNRVKEARIALENVLKEQANISFEETVYLYRIAALYYERVNQNDLALSYYKKILAKDLKKNYYSEFVYNPTLFMIYYEMGAIYVKIGQLDEAEKYFKNAKSIVKSATTPLQPGLFVTFYSHLYKYELARRNYPAAIKNLERRDVIKDSIFTAQKDKQIAEFNVQYQTTQKELSIKDLHSKQIAQQARLDEANLQRNITVGGIALLLIFSGLGYKAYRSKQQSNLQLLAKQEKINTQNVTLQHLLTEKDWLLKEVHHRVKNNLHTVICLLEAQARNLENDALDAIENSQHRIYAMSLIHQKLYQSDDIKTIDMAEYIPELIQSLEESFGNSQQIKFNLHIDPVALTLSQAIPIGLILNEAVTNSIKYAFPDNRGGEILVVLTDKEDQITLEVADNGIGMPPFDIDAEHESLGLRLINGLCNEIDGKITFEVVNGTRIVIVFKPDPFVESEKHSTSTDHAAAFI